MKRSLAVLGVFCFSLSFAASLEAEPLDAKTQASVDRGLKWLAARWADDAPLDVVVARSRAGTTAITALSGLAFLAADDAKPGEGPYGAPARRCLDAVLTSQKGDGTFAADAAHGPMYGHGFATAFVAEAFGRSKDPALKKPLENAVALIAASQNEEGGWRYQPKPLDADVSVTAVQFLALRAAERAGIAVDQKVIERAVAYLAKCQNDDGGFRYMAANPGGGGSGVPRTAAATTALNASGKATEADRARAMEYLSKQLRDGKPAWQDGGHFHYASYYLAEALWHAGGTYREKDLAACREILLSRQLADGSWTGDLNSEYATATALIALQAPGERLAFVKPAGQAPQARANPGR